MKKNKVKKIGLIGILLVSLFLASFKSIPFAKADENYSNYLENESLTIENDRALILVNPSTSSSNYRNFYESDFTFPNKLSNDMFTTDLTENPSKYYVSQTYLDNLDDEKAFKSVDNLGLYESNDYIDDYTNFTENNGYYNNTIFENSISYILNPNSDINTDFISEPVGNHYSCLDDGYLENDDDDYILVDNTNNINDYDLFDFDNQEIYHTFDSLRVGIYYNRTYGIDSETFSIGLYDGYIWHNDIISMPSSSYWLTYYADFNDLEITNENINDLQFRIRLENIISSPYSIRFHSIFIELSKTFDYNSNTLQDFDVNSYNFISNGTGTSGLFHAEYSFTDDSIGSNPTGWSIDEGGGTINVISELDEHSKIVEVYDNNAGNDVILYNNFAESAYGTIEFWIRTNDATATSFMNLKSVGGAATRIQIFIENEKFWYYDGSIHEIRSCLDNTWYHYQVNYETTTGNYKGLSQYKFNVEIDSIEYGDYSMYGTGTIGQLYIASKVASVNYYTYYDAIDYSWSDGYYENRNKESSVYNLNLTSSLEINRNGNIWDNIESLELEYVVKSNYTVDLDLYLLNQDSLDFDLINTNSITTSFQEFTYSFSLNYSYYSRIGIIDFMFYINDGNSFYLSLDKINLKTTFSNYSITNKGSHDLDIIFYRETIGSTHRGNITLNLQLYKTNFSYNYIENNVIENDYSSLNNFIDFSSESEPIREFEIQCHIRYGLNTLDIEIVNIYYFITINYNFTYEIFEQVRYGNQDGAYFKYKFGYTSNNFIRLNQTGIFGNYSYNCLKGIRLLKGVSDISYNRYFTIPSFNNKIVLTSIGIGLTETESEPNYPLDKYWSYTAYKVSEFNLIYTDVGNWTNEFQTIRVSTYEAKHPYDDKTWDKRDFPSFKWTFKFSDDFKFTIDFNFFRDTMINIMNILSLFGQWMIYLGYSIANMVFTYVISSIVVFLWNTPMYYLQLFLHFALWYLYLGLHLLISGLVWFYEYVVLPFLRWVRDYLLPIIVEFLIYWCSIGITWILYFITFGQIDFNETQQIVYDILWLIVIELYNWIITFINNMFYILLFVIWYLICMGYLYLRYLLARSRGFKEKAERYYYTLTFFIIPIKFVVDWIKELLGITPYF